MRTAVEVEQELADVRAERKEYYNPQSEPLAPDSARLFDLDIHEPHAALAQLLDHEAHLVLELVDIRRMTGTPSPPGEQEQVDAAMRIIQRIDAARIE